ncbi:hypothetical protein ACGE24_08160 [Corynebacterium kroppenstedtii]|uniref:hypothetical protein n=1 Tax=Corynebacterium sp. PCR 32 TaxID=3351342 RepID=UPI00309CD8A4
MLTRRTYRVTFPCETNDADTGQTPTIRIPSSHRITTTQADYACPPLSPRSPPTTATNRPTPRRVHHHTTQHIAENPAHKKQFTNH